MRGTTSFIYFRPPHSVPPPSHHLPAPRTPRLLTTILGGCSLPTTHNYPKLLKHTATMPIRTSIPGLSLRLRPQVRLQSTRSAKSYTTAEAHIPHGHAHHGHHAQRVPYKKPSALRKWGVRFGTFSILTYIELTRRHVFTYSPGHRLSNHIHSWGCISPSASAVDLPPLLAPASTQGQCEGQSAHE